MFISQVQMVITILLSEISLRNYHYVAFLAQLSAEPTPCWPHICAKHFSFHTEVRRERWGADACEVTLELHSVPDVGVHVSPRRVLTLGGESGTQKTTQV